MTDFKIDGLELSNKSPAAIQTHLASIIYGLFLSKCIISGVDRFCSSQRDIWFIYSIVWLPLPETSNFGNLSFV